MSLAKKITWLTLFSIAMGFMETVVVVYLRKLYYPDGFSFPLVSMDSTILAVEFLREAATLIMLLAIGILAGKTASQKFAFFIFCFAIWDLFYYVFLKVVLDWPESFFTWDILFLIPVPWVGPVIAPCIVSLTMIFLTISIVYFAEKGLNTKLKNKEWLLFICGSLIVIFSFSSDYFKYISFSDKKIINRFTPVNFNWLLFCTGELLIIFQIGLYLKRIKNENESVNKNT
ncbi:MAG TPA: hypothetical protein VLB84_10745 [Bacteroidia bacterium]|nr:hypothetical protein [Bacteroidia bacterium]